MLKTIAQSIAPALERVALILDDGMSDVTLACDTITLLAETRMRIQREVFAGAEWIKWLRYGMFPTYVCLTQKSPGPQLKTPAPRPSLLHCTIRGWSAISCGKTSEPLPFSPN